MDEESSRFRRRMYGRDEVEVSSPRVMHDPSLRSGCKDAEAFLQCPCLPSYEFLVALPALPATSLIGISGHLPAMMLSFPVFGAVHWPMRSDAGLCLVVQGQWDALHVLSVFRCRGGAKPMQRGCGLELPSTCKKDRTTIVSLAELELFELPTLH